MGGLAGGNRGGGAGQTVLQIWIMKAWPRNGGGWHHRCSMALQGQALVVQRGGWASMDELKNQIVNDIEDEFVNSVLNGELVWDVEPDVTLKGFIDGLAKHIPKYVGKVDNPTDNENDGDSLI